MEIEYKGTTIDIPFDLSERTVNQHADFKAREQDYLKACVEGNEKPDDEDVTIQINQALLETVQQIAFGDLSKLKMSHVEDDVQSMFENGYHLNPTQEPSILRIYTHYVTMVKEYKPSRMEMTYSVKWWADQEKTKQETYWIENNEAMRLFDQKAYTSGEVIVLQEWRRRIKNQVQQKGDPEGNLALTMDQTDLAILLRKQGEKLPVNQNKRRRWLNKRKRVFNDFPLDELLRVRFFLINIGVAYAKLQTTASFLNRKNQPSSGTQKNKSTNDETTIIRSLKPNKDSN